jgi:hypothetical protein
MVLALGKLTTGTPKFRGSGFVGMHVKSITAQKKFNFPRANAILARAQALLWVRDCILGGKIYFSNYELSSAAVIEFVLIFYVLTLGFTAILKLYF